MSRSRTVALRATNSFLALALLAGAGIIDSLAVPASASTQNRSISAGSASSQVASHSTVLRAGSSRVVATNATSPTRAFTNQNLTPTSGSSLRVSAAGHKSFTLSLGGSGATIHATPTPAVRPAPTQTTTTVSLLGSRGQVVVPANGKVPYGELLTVVATVTETPGNKPVTSGIVTFTENGASVKPEFSSSAVCQAVPVVNGTATCGITALAARSTPYTFGASYTPDQSSLTSSTVTSAHGVAVTVVRASTTTSLSGGPNLSSPGTVSLRAIVANSAAGSSLAPTGTVSFERGGVTLACAQGLPVLTEASPTTSSASCDVPASSGSATYTALYIPTVTSDYATSGPQTVSVSSGSLSQPVGSSSTSSPNTVPAVRSGGPSSLAVTAHTSGSCSSIFSTLWSDGASGSTTLTFAPGSSVATLLANLSVTEAATSGTCDPTANITFSAGALSFLGNTLSGSSLSGTITDATPSPLLCVTSGDLSGEGVTVSGSLCFTISAATNTGGTVDNVSSVSLNQVGQVSIASVLTLSGVSVTIGNGSVTTPQGCSLTSSSDWWLTVSGNLALALTTPNVSASATATGCVDLSAGTKGTLELTAQLGKVDLGSSVTLNNFDLVLTYSSTTFTALGSASATVDMGSGAQVTFTVTVAFDSSGSLVVGGSVDLSSFLPSSLTGGGDVAAFVAFATAAYPSFDTGITSIGSIDLVPGLNFAISASLPSSITTALSNVNITLPSTVVAVGSFDTSTDTFQLAINLTFANPVQLFDNQGVILDLDSAVVTLSVSPSQVSISFAMNGTLFPDGATGQQVDVSGTLSATVSATPSVSISVSVNEPTVGTCGTGSGWSNAFSDTGLTVQCAELTVGVTDVLPFVTGSINGVITQLPTDMANAIGYQQNAPIAFAFGFNPYYLDLSIGTYGSNTPALEPLTAFDNGSYASDLQVAYAQLCLYVPTGTDPPSITLGGGLTCTPGYLLAFTASIDASIFAKPVTVNFLAQLSIGSPTSFDFSVSISEITIGSGLNIGPVSLVVCGSTQQTCDNNTSYFQFEFSGSVSLSGSVTVPNFIQLSGNLTLSVDISLSTSGFTALASGSGSGSVTFWNALSNCSGTWYDPTTWYCAGGWGSTASVSFSLGTTGIVANTSGVTLSVDGQSITFPFSSSSPVVVPPPTTSTTLSSSVNGTSSSTSTYGQPVTLTATVTASGGTFDGGGSVSFYLGSNNGQFAIPGCSGAHAVALSNNNGSYTATCTTSTDVVPSSGDTMILPAGSDSIVAQYSGDANFPVSTSGPVTETVNAATPTLTITSSPNPDTYGQSLTLSVSVSPTDGGGTVTFQDNGTNVAGCSNLKLAGDSGLGLGTDYSVQASCAAGNLVSAGTHVISVSYTGDASASAAQSSTDVVVNKDNTTTRVSLSPTQATYGNESSSVVTVTVSTGYGETLPTTDQVTVHVGTATCTASVAPSTGGGTGTCSIANTALGANSTAYTVTATYPGDADLNSSAQATAPTGLTVIKDNTTTRVSVSPTQATYGNESASVVTVTVSTGYGETLPTTDQVTVHVGSATCTASVAPSTGGGTGTCSIGNIDLGVSSTAYTVTATYPGDADLNGSAQATAPTGLTVNKDHTVTSVSASPSSSPYATETSVIFSVTVAPHYGEPVPNTGESVTIHVGSTSCTTVLTITSHGATGSCTIAVAVLPVGGPYVVSVTYLGDNDLLGSTGTNSFNVVTTYTPDCSHFAGANLAGANLAGANLTGCNLSGANLMGANLEGASLAGANLTGANLMGANLQGDNLVNADLQGTNLKGDNILYANLAGVDLHNANLMYADLYETYDFSGANLTGANFQHANLEYANLQDSNLTDANFHYANLSYANLTNAIVKGAQFKGATMTGVVT